MEYETQEKIQIGCTIAGCLLGVAWNALVVVLIILGIMVLHKIACQ